MVLPSIMRYVCLLVLCTLSALKPVASFAPLSNKGASVVLSHVPAPITQQPTPVSRGLLTVLQSSASRKTDHDYERTDDTSDIDEDVINELISERIQARKNGYYKRADVILDELYQKHGVMVQDHEKTWRAGGARREPDPNRNNDDPYVQSGHSEGADTLSSDDIDHIQDRLAQRVRAKKKRDFRAADAIREELREQFNVYIEDRKRAWSVGGNFGVDSSGRKAQNDLSYSRSAHSLDAKDLEEYILAQIEKRTAARKSRNYEESDAIREALKVEHNVHINDRLQEWSVGGDFGYN
jgi:cysteinyl-tRNA synthetase